jgi:predicted ferric reductase
MANSTKQIVLGAAKQRKLARLSDGLQVAVVFGVLLPLLAMLGDGAASNLDSAYAWINFVNRFSALSGTALLLLHLVLVARVPWIEAIVGLDRLTGAHKKLGKPLLYVLSLHVATAIWASAEQNGIGLWDGLILLVAHYQEMLIALVGFGLMILVTVSSINAARKKLSYEVWYLIHLTSYIAVFLSIPHQFAFGSEFLAQPWLSTYFAALYIFVLANVVWFRSLQPVISSLRLGLRVTKVEPTTNNATSVYISGKHTKSFNFKSGQFYMVRVMTLIDFWKPHPFSASNSSGERYLRFTIGNRGDFTSRMQSIKVGTRIVLEGPYGIFTEAKRTKQKVTLIAGGIGVAPIRSLAQQLASKPNDLTILYRANNARDATLAKELVAIAEGKGHELHVLTGERSSRVPWLPASIADSSKLPDYALLTQLAPDILDSDVYVCGPTQWTKEFLATLNKLSVPKSQIHVEEFAW